MSNYSIFGERQSGTAFNHVCGSKLCYCNHCLALFCPECDYFGSGIKLCCKKAIESAVKDGDKKFHRIPVKSSAEQLKEINDKTGRSYKSKKQKVDIKEIEVINNQELHAKS
jgi:hypothetical protein